MEKIKTQQRDDDMDGRALGERDLEARVEDEKITLQLLRKSRIFCMQLQEQNPHPWEPRTLYRT